MFFLEMPRRLRRGSESRENRCQVRVGTVSLPDVMSQSDEEERTVSVDRRGRALHSTGTPTQPLEQPRQESGGLHACLGLHARFMEP